MKSDPKRNQPRPGRPANAGTPLRHSDRRNSGRDEAEPSVGHAPAPIWLVVVFGALFYWCQIYLDNTAAEFNPNVYFAYKSVAAVEAANPRDENKIFIARGKAVYESVCFGCHQVNGLGTAGQFPPLAGSEWVTAPGPNRLIRIPLHGLTGPITVGGTQWNLEMGPFGADLPNEDLAAVLTYIRQAWGNNAPPVTPEQVAAVRQETASRPPIGAPWTADELLKLPDSL